MDEHVKIKTSDMDKRIIKIVPNKMHEEDPDAMSFFVELNQTIPSWKRINGPFLFNQFLELTKNEFGDDMMIDWVFEEDEYQQVLIRVKYKDSFILIRNRRTHSADDDIYEIKSGQKKYRDKKHGIIIATEIDILFNYYVGLPEDYLKKLEKTRLSYSDSFNKIHLLCQDNETGLYTKELPMVSADLSFDLDLHYGEGFAKYHEVNIKRITEQTKGLILLHGSPGTGKSYYIRRLIKDLAKCKKNILYMPNNMVDMIGTPGFNNFLLDWIDDRMEDDDTKKPGILLVIEDAERVLIKRDINQYGADGVANILNSSDGILNDFLNIQVLATFNSDIKMIDEAVLRKKRALSIREFNKLSKEDAQKVIDKYEIDYKATEPMSLAEIFSLKQDDDDTILFGDSNKPTKGIGFK